MELRLSLLDGESEFVVVVKGICLPGFVVHSDFFHLSMPFLNGRIMSGLAMLSQ